MDKKSSARDSPIIHVEQGPPAIESILVGWLECILDTEVDGSNPGSCMLFP